MTVHHWGEDPHGMWTLTILDVPQKRENPRNGTLKKWRLELHGTEIHPQPNWSPPPPPEVKQPSEYAKVPEENQPDSKLIHGCRQVLRTLNLTKLIKIFSSSITKIVMSCATLADAAVHRRVIVDFANMFIVKATKNVCSRVPLENMQTQTDTVEPVAIPVHIARWILIDAPIAQRVTCPMDRAFVNGR